jgi:hypothetical protein
MKFMQAGNRLKLKLLPSNYLKLKILPRRMSRESRELVTKKSRELESKLQNHITELKELLSSTFYISFDRVRSTGWAWNSSIWRGFHNSSFKKGQPHLLHQLFVPLESSCSENCHPAQGCSHNSDPRHESPYKHM